MKRARPKSVSLTSGTGSSSSGTEPVDVGGSKNGLTVKRMSDVSSHRHQKLTLQLDVAVDDFDLVQPRHGTAELAEDTADEAVPFGIVGSRAQHAGAVCVNLDKGEQLAALQSLEHETVMRRCREVRDVAYNALVHEVAQYLDLAVEGAGIARAAHTRLAVDHLHGADAHGVGRVDGRHARVDEFRSAWRHWLGGPHGCERAKAQRLDNAPGPWILRALDGERVVVSHGHEDVPDLDWTAARFGVVRFTRDV